MCWCVTTRRGERWRRRPPATPLPRRWRRWRCARRGRGGGRAPARSARAAGTWRLVYSRQGAGANPFQRLLAGQVANFQIISEDGSALENRVELAPGVRVRALAAAEADSASRTGVDIEQVVLEAGPLR